MSSAVVKSPITPEEYLALERKSPFKNEYDNGFITAMSGASRAFRSTPARVACESGTTDLISVTRTIPDASWYPSTSIEPRSPRIDHQAALGNLHLQGPLWVAPLLEELCDALRYFRVVDRPHGQIHRHLNLQADVVPRSLLLECGGQDPVSQEGDHPRVLRHRDEVIRRHEPTLGMPPANERLDR